MKKSVMLLISCVLIVLSLPAYITTNSSGDYVVQSGDKSFTLQQDMDTVYLLPQIKERNQGQTLRVPTIEELKSVFDDFRTNNYDTVNVSIFSLSFTLGFYKGYYGYNYCYLFVTKNGVLGTVQVDSNTLKMNEKSFTEASDPYDRCPPTILWRIIE